MSFLLSAPLGLEREAHSRTAGLRTFPLVAMTSCGFMLVGLSVVGDDVDARARLLYGLMTGIGFIGGGAIFKANDGVHGTATATSIWNMGAVGAAVAFRRWEIAILLSILNLAILWLSPSVKQEINGCSPATSPASPEAEQNSPQSSEARADLSAHHSPSGLKDTTCDHRAARSPPDASRKDQEQALQKESASFSARSFA
ncbi:MAG: MgtC/SapB family protein [Bdellovibrionales bacterium]|nr:MgtC/SapB family protein [Bdellovibrionales bacterium]